MTTLIRPEQENSEFNAIVAALEAQLNDLRHELEEYQIQLRAGSFDDVKAATRTVSDLRQWLRIALEVEIQLEKRHRREQGIVNDYAIDFDAARDQIGSRLARLRNAGCPGPLPKCPQRR